MTRRIVVVEDTFEIKGRGLLLVPGILPKEGELFRVGDPIRLRRPDGAWIHTRIDDLQCLSSNPPAGDIVIMLAGFAKSDIPVGTEVWSVADA